MRTRTIFSERSNCSTITAEDAEVMEETEETEEAEGVAIRELEGHQVVHKKKPIHHPNLSLNPRLEPKDAHEA